MITISGRIVKENLLFLIISSVLIGSCKREAVTNTQIFDEFTLDTELSSIWSSPDNNNLWIGTKSGEIILHNGKEVKWRLDSQKNKIYKVVPETQGKDTTLLIGLQNAGLQKLTVRNSEIVENNFYPIDCKGIDYSAYDFCTINDSIILVATSNGIYRLNIKVSQAKMNLVFPRKDSLAQRSYEYPVYKLCPYKNGTIVCATPSGIIIYDENSNNKINKIIAGTNLNYVTSFNDTVYTLSKGQITIYDGIKTKTIRCKDNPNIIFQDNNHNKWIISEFNVKIGKDINKYDEFVNIDLPKSIPYLSERNLITSKEHCTYLITTKSILRAPVHLGIYTNSDIVSICSDNLNSIYFITSSNLLYKKDGNENARFIKKIEAQGKIQWSAVSGIYLYFHTGGNSLYRTKLSTNHIFGSNTEDLFKNQKEIGNILSARLFQDPNKRVAKIMIGTKNGLFYINIKRERPQITISNGLKDKDIIRISNNISDYHIAATINDGIYKAYLLQNRDWQRKVIKTNLDNKWINDVCPIDDQNILILTNRQLYLDQTDRVDSVGVKNLYKLIPINDTTLYAIGLYGIHKIGISNNKLWVDSTRIFPDITFNPNAYIVMPEQTLYIGSKLGVIQLKITGNNLFEKWINFDNPTFFDKRIVFPYLGILLLIVVFIISTLLLLRKVSIKNEAEKIELFEERRKILEQKMNALKAQAELTNNAQEDLNIQQLIENCERVVISGNAILFDQLIDEIEKKIRVLNKAQVLQEKGKGMYKVLLKLVSNAVDLKNDFEYFFVEDNESIQKIGEIISEYEHSNLLSNEDDLIAETEKLSNSILFYHNKFSRKITRKLQNQIEELEKIASLQSKSMAEESKIDINSDLVQIKLRVVSNSDWLNIISKILDSYKNIDDMYSELLEIDNLNKGYRYRVKEAIRNIFELPTGDCIREHKEILSEQQKLTTYNASKIIAEYINNNLIVKSDQIDSEYHLRFKNQLNEMIETTLSNPNKNLEILKNLEFFNEEFIFLVNMTMLRKLVNEYSRHNNYNGKESGISKKIVDQIRILYNEMGKNTNYIFHELFSLDPFTNKAKILALFLTNIPIKDAHLSKYVSSNSDFGSDANRLRKYITSIKPEDPFNIKLESLFHKLKYNSLVLGLILDFRESAQKNLKTRD